MAEKKKTSAVSRSTAPKKANHSKTSRRKKGSPPRAVKTSRFFEGMGNEITGIFLIGLGLLLTAGIFTDRVGRLGELLKSFAIASFGSLGYLFPVLLIALGIAFILRQRGFLLNRRALGALLILFALLILLSVGQMYLLKEMTLPVALGKIAALTEKKHGGVTGFLLAYPLLRLVGEVGTYIFSVLTLLLGGVLMLNTTVYDSLRKGKTATVSVQSKISDLREKNRAMGELSGKEKERLAVPPALREDGQAPAKSGALSSSPRDREKEEFTYHSFNSQAKPTKLSLTPEETKSLASSKAGEDRNKLTLPPFMASNGGGATPKARQNPSVSRFNIELKQFEGNSAQPKAARSKPEEPNNPVTVPYLENWNKVRDKKNPRLEDQQRLAQKTQDAEKAAQNPPAAAAGEYASREAAFNAAGQGHRDESDAELKVEKAMSLEEFQNYRRNRLARTEPPRADKGRQLEMEEPERKKPIYRYPGVSLLKENMRGVLNDDDQHEIMETARKLQDTLGTFGVDARVIDVSRGPSVTRYELQLKAGIKVSKVMNLSDDIALSLAASGVRIEAPIPGKAAVGIEIPNRETVPVFLREVIDSDKFTKSSQKLAIALGKDISGEVIIGDLAKYPHVLIAGSTGSGKSVCINSMIVSLLYKYPPEEVRLIMIDPKMVELSVYNGIPHLLIPVVTDPKKAAGALNWAVNEMTRRYDLFNNSAVRNIEGYNDLKAKGKIEEKLPYIVVIVDELADLMMVAAGEVESYIARLAQMARAAGMHLVIATQRPSVDVITGVIKANIPSRISFAVASYVDSKTILDQGGAEKLLGKGDMLYNPMGAHKPRRVQGAFISEEEVESIVSSIKVVEEALQYDESIIQHIENGGAGRNGRDEEADELFDEAVRVVIENNQASTSFLQRKMRIGYNRAARIIDDLEDRGVISGPDGAKPRKIIWTGEDLDGV